jgi:hypothetical protein
VQGVRDSFVGLVTFSFLLKPTRVERRAEAHGDLFKMRQDTSRRQRLVRALQKHRHHGNTIFVQQDAYSGLKGLELAGE